MAAVLSLTNCKQARSLDKKANERNVIHMSITDIGCSRIQSSSTISIPLVNTPNAVVQTIKDLQDKNTLDWKSAIILYDSSAVSDEILSSIKETLSQKASIL